MQRVECAAIAIALAAGSELPDDEGYAQIYMTHGPVSRLLAMDPIRFLRVVVGLAATATQVGHDLNTT